MIIPTPTNERPRIRGRMTPYAFFVQERREYYRQQGVPVQFTAFSKECSALWKVGRGPVWCWYIHTCWLHGCHLDIELQSVGCLCTYILAAYNFQSSCAVLCYICHCYGCVCARQSVVSVGSPAPIGTSKDLTVYSITTTFSPTPGNQ